MKAIFWMRGNKGAINSMKGQAGRSALLKLSGGNSDIWLYLIHLSRSWYTWCRPSPPAPYKKKFFHISQQDLAAFCSMNLDIEEECLAEWNNFPVMFRKILCLEKYLISLNALSSHKLYSIVLTCNS